MEIITSQDNKKIKNIVKLKQKKYRDEQKLYLIEGYKNVLDSVTARSDLLDYVILSESAYKTVGELFIEYPCVVVTDAVFGKFSDTETSRGVACINKIVMPTGLPKSDRCILLDRVRDPGNVGTILRSAVACGYDIVLNNCADMYSPKVVRSAMSAVVKCNAYEDIPVAALKKSGYEMIVADMHGDNVFTSKHSDKYCVVIGNEAEGVSRDIVSAADRLLCIPQENMESLNAGVAAGIMMFALRYARL